MTERATPDVKSVPVPDDLPPAESKPRRDDEKGDRLAIERGNRDRGPSPAPDPDPERPISSGSGRR